MSLLGESGCFFPSPLVAKSIPIYIATKGMTSQEVRHCLAKIAQGKDRYNAR